MRDDGGDFIRRGLWFAGGCAALGAVLLLRMQGAAYYPPWLAWTSLVLALGVAAAAIETGRDYVDLTLTGVGFGAAVLGMLLFAVGWLVRYSNDGLLDLGPIFTLAGFATGIVCTGISLREVFADLMEAARERRASTQAEEEEETGPTKACPRCGKKIALYAAACRHCRCILRQ